jgi:hypothetical protein
MGLLANPVTMNDGVGDRIFTFRSQEPDSKSVYGVYVETAAALSADSRFNVKHDSKTATPRHLFQRSTYLVPAAGTELLRITQNYTLTCSKLFTIAEVTPEFVLFRDALAEASFIDGFMGSLI